MQTHRLDTSLIEYLNVENPFLLAQIFEDELLEEIPEEIEEENGIEPTLDPDYTNLEEEEA